MIIKFFTKHLKFLPATEDSPLAQTVLHERRQEIELQPTKPGSWLKINPGSIGFHRTRYSPEMLARLVPAIENLSLPPQDRYSLLNDALAIAKSGQASTVELLRLLRAYHNEDSYTVWTIISTCMAALDNLVRHLDASYPAFQRFCRALLSNVSARLGWESVPGEPHLDTLLRTLVLNRLVMLEDGPTIAEAERRFAAHSKTPIPADLRSGVYRAVVMNGDAGTMKRMKMLHRSADLHEEKDRILGAMGAARSEESLREALEFAIGGDVRAQSMINIFPVASRTRWGRLLVWRFARDNWSLLSERCDSGGLRNRLVQFVVEDIVDKEALAEVEGFFQEHCRVGTERIVRQSVEKIRLNIAWLERERVPVERFFKEV